MCHTTTYQAPFQLPSQGKFSTLDESNYIANPHLCGSDIKKSFDDNKSVIFEEPDFQGGDDETSIDLL